MEINLQTTKIQISYSDLQIIEGLKSEENENLLNFFQSMFFQKFKGYVYKLAMQRCISFPDPAQLASDVTQQTFINAFKKIKDFDLSREPKLERHEFMIKAWLGTIGNNCFNKEYEKRKYEVYLDDYSSKIDDNSFDLFESLYGCEIVDIPNEFRSTLNEAMNTLSEEQKYVLLTYAEEGCIKSNRHLSQEAMARLCKLYNTSSANIRQIKKRSLDKIIKHCNYKRK